MWKIKDNVEGKSKLENAKDIKKKLEELNGKIKEIHKLEVGINIVNDPQAHDLILYSQFNSIDELSWL